MKKTLPILFLLFSISVLGQTSYEKEIQEYQEGLSREFMDPEESPLSKKQIKKFKGHDYFPIDSVYRVVAKFTRYSIPITFKMETSTSRLPDYDKFGIAEFELHDEKYTLTIYQSHRLRSMEEHKDHLFLPFTDLTNGQETYEGGRYIDLSIPEGNTIVIDFNKAYNPYCVYGHQYSCPIPPAENHLEIRIEAGILNSSLK